VGEEANFLFNESRWYLRITGYRFTVDIALSTKRYAWVFFDFSSYGVDKCCFATFYLKVLFVCCFVFSGDVIFKQVKKK